MLKFLRLRVEFNIHLRNSQTDALGISKIAPHAAMYRELCETAAQEARRVASKHRDAAALAQRRLSFGRKHGAGVYEITTASTDHATETKAAADATELATWYTQHRAMLREIESGYFEFRGYVKQLTKDQKFEDEMDKLLRRAWRQLTVKQREAVSMAADAVVVPAVACHPRMVAANAAVNLAVSAAADARRARRELRKELTAELTEEWKLNQPAAIDEDQMTLTELYSQELK